MSRIGERFRHSSTTDDITFRMHQLMCVGHARSSSPGSEHYCINLSLHNREKNDECKRHFTLERGLSERHIQCLPAGFTNFSNFSTCGDCFVCLFN